MREARPCGVSPLRASSERTRPSVVPRLAASSLAPSRTSSSMSSVVRMPRSSRIRHQTSKRLVDIRRGFRDVARPEPLVAKILDREASLFEFLLALSAELKLSDHRRVAAFSASGDRAVLTRATFKYDSRRAYCARQRAGHLFCSCVPKEEKMTRALELLSVLNEFVEIFYSVAQLRILVDICASPTS
jgi:hypothetical protein